MFKYLFLILVVVVFVGFVIKLNLRNTTSSASISTSIKSDKSELKVNEKTNITVYLGGPEAKNVTAGQIDLKFDKNYFKVLSVNPGKFYKKALPIKIDNAGLFWAYSIDPSMKDDKTAINPTEAFLVVQVQALKVAPNLVVSTGPETKFYVSKIGGMTPSLESLTLSIN